MNQTEKIEKARRDFLKKLAAAVAAAPFVVGCKSVEAELKPDVLTLIRKNARPAGSEGMGAIDVPANVSRRTALAKKSDRDLPMLITGTVYEPDGKTPAPNVLIYFYHTDSEGVYGKTGEPKHGHFRGWLLTDAKGRYEFRSIKPAVYPSRRFAAHVHMTVTGTTFKEDWIDSILFADDELISDQERRQAGQKGGFNPILKLEKDADGVLRGVRDIQLWKA